MYFIKAIYSNQLAIRWPRRHVCNNMDFKITKLIKLFVNSLMMHLSLLLHKVILQRFLISTFLIIIVTAAAAVVAVIVVVVVVVL